MTVDAAKAQLDIEAPSGGTILEVVVDVGDIPLVGDLLVVLDAD
jgi:pyruvate/2-oxoglutarate dehydrogenase complex dihydrolipoamide acyltransferase (E2) component